MKVGFTSVGDVLHVDVRGGGGTRTRSDAQASSEKINVVYATGPVVGMFLHTLTQSPGYVTH